MDYFKDMTSSTGFKTRPVTLVVILVALLAFFTAEGKIVSYNATEPSNPENRTVRRPPVDRGKMDTAKKIAAARQRCFDEVLMKPYPTDGRLYCNRTWDGWGCWNDTPAGEVAFTNCPSFMEGFDPWLKANKICTINGTWWIHPMTGKRWSNYTTCVDRTGMQVVGYDPEPGDLKNRTAPRQPVGPRGSEQQKKNIAEAKQRCFEEVLSKPYPTDGRLYCNRTWDGWGCWNDTPAGGMAYINCPRLKGLNVRLKASKTCTINGTWWAHPVTGRPWSNYTSCIDLSQRIETDKAVLTVFIAGYSASMVAMVLSLIIFFSFKQLNCDRITLHKNLFISYVLNGLLWILFYTLVAYDPVVLGQNPLWCRVMHICTSYFTVCNFFWMFNEGLYLHTIIVVAFSSGKKLLIGCHLIGWVLPIIPVTIYTLLRSLSSDEQQKLSCWLHETDLHWINAGPVVASLVLNLIFLCNIIRVLVTKLRAVNSPDTNQTKKAVRATIILVPLLGLQYIIIPFRPEPNSTEERVYLVVAAVLVSFQGLFVALIFCFFNGEVISIMKRKWGQHQLMRGRSIGKGAPCTTITQTPNDYKMTDGSGKKPMNCDPTSPCLENNVNDKNKPKSKHKFYRFGRHKQREDTVCCSSV